MLSYSYLKFPLCLWLNFDKGQRNIHLVHLLEMESQGFDPI